MTQTTNIEGLEGLLRAGAAGKLPPVDQWDPPYCGDIGMSIRPDGVWLYQGSPIGRMALVKLFASVLRRDPDGRHYLVTPAEKVDVTVEDAPFLAVEMQTDGEPGPGQQLVFRTNVDDIVRCGPANPLMFRQEAVSGGLKPYLLVRGRLEALVTRALYYDLVELAVPDDSDAAGTSAGEPRLVVWSGGQAFPVEAEG
jgi:hypothetical protein